MTPQTPREGAARAGQLMGLLELQHPGAVAVLLSRVDFALVWAYIAAHRNLPPDDGHPAFRAITSATGLPVFQAPRELVESPMFLTKEEWESWKQEELKGS